MPLTLTLDPLALALTVACAATAAAMHWSAVVGGGHELPPRRLQANLVAAAVGGAITAQALDLVPVLSISPLVAILIAAITGHALGPGALYWFGRVLVGAARKRGMDVPDLPPPPPDVPPPEVKP